MTLLRAEPMYFGPRQRPLFGWLHRPAIDGPAPRDVGLVLCNPFGYEAVCAHRTLRHIADGAARMGIPACRFDYDGTGDSTGSDLDPARLDAWIASIHAACEALREATGVTQICLLGVRLGATLTALAALDRSDVAALIAIAPVVKPKSYLRELRAFQAAIGANGAADDDLLEVAGYFMTRETSLALAETDLSKLARAPARRVLIVDRAELPAAKAWSDVLAGWGSDVTYRTVTDFERLATTPHAKTPPAEIIAASLDHLQETGRGAGTCGSFRSAPVVSSVAQADVTPAVRETAAFLGESDAFFAIVSETAAATPARPRRGFVLLNAGATHHIGFSRLYVDLARNWAAGGDVVLRMDIRGIGDSPPRDGEPENHVYPTTAVADIARAAASLRQSHGVTEVIAIGLCAGAYHALKAAAAEIPLNALILINPLTFFWKEGMSLDTEFPADRIVRDAARYQRNLLRLDSWKKLLTGKVDMHGAVNVIARRSIESVRLVLRGVARTLGLPVTDDLAAELRVIAGRSSIHFIFSASDPGLQLLNEQGGAMVHRLRQSNAISVTLIDGANHTFTARQARESLVAQLGRILNAGVKPQPAEH